MRRLYRLLSPCALVFALIGMPGSAAAHEFILKPQAAPAYASGQDVKLSVLSAHVFMQSEELEAASDVIVSMDGKTVPLNANEAAKTYDGSVKLSKPGAAIVRGHRKGQIWSKTTQGMKKGGRAELGDIVVEARSYEKFAKTLLPVGGKADGFDAVVGDLLEIVPVGNPLTAKAGDVVGFKVLYEGKPVAATVAATWDGFTDVPNSYGYFTETDDDNIAKIKLWHSGFWMVRVQHEAPVQGKDYQKVVLRAVLAFPVK